LGLLKYKNRKLGRKNNYKNIESIFDQLVEEKKYDKQEITKNNYFDCSGNSDLGSCSSK